MKGREILILVGLIILAGLFFSQEINLVNADLGRHLKNGENFFISTNFYSYTQPDLSVVNHHWLSGAIFYRIHKLFGFIGLSLFNISILLTAFIIFFLIAYKKSDFNSALFFSLLVLPLIAWRAEIRPEIFSFLLLAVFFYVLISKKPLWVLLPLQILWVNLHIFFVFGLVLAGIFWLAYKKKEYGFLLLGLISASLINPAFFRGLLEPFMIFREYGYMVAENQPIWFMQLRFPARLIYWHFELLFILFIAALFLRRKIIRPEVLMAAVFVLSSWAINRMIPVFAFFILPIMARSFRIKYLTPSLLLSFIFILSINNFYPLDKNIGLGLIPKVNASAEFYKENNISGPIFNNYDIGGYLIFHDIRVFIDNRPEAYSIDFLDDYKLAQKDENKWHDLDEKYNFNAIYFYRHDMTPNAQPFLIKRIEDADWAPIFVDDYALLLLKRNDKNKKIIKEFVIPNEKFIYSRNAHR